MSSVPGSNVGPSSANEEQVRKAAQIKEWIEAKISDLEGEIEKLRDMLTIVDGNLRRTSFVSAAQLRPVVANPVISGSPARAESQSAGQKPLPAKAEIEADQRLLKRAKDGLLLARAKIDPQRIVILPASGIRLIKSTPPFQSFFVKKILDGYKTKDSELVKKGSLSENSSLKYEVEERNGEITKITVQNYRDKSRLSEIIGTLTWAFTRMLEK